MYGHTNVHTTPYHTPLRTRLYSHPQNHLHTYLHHTLHRPTPILHTSYSHPKTSCTHIRHTYKHHVHVTHTDPHPTYTTYTSLHKHYTHPHTPPIYDHGHTYTQPHTSPISTVHYGTHEGLEQTPTRVWVTSEFVPRCTVVVSYSETHIRHTYKHHTDTEPSTTPPPRVGTDRDP